MKKFIIALILIAGVQGQANAQFLKKLGNAIEKAAKTVDDVANAVLGESNTSNSNNKERQVCKPYMIGDTKVSIYGEQKTDILLSDLSAARIYSDTRVLLNYQLNNTSMEKSYNINMGIGDNDKTLFVDDSGKQYSHGWTDLGGGLTLYDCTKSATILDDTKLNCRMLIIEVPTSVTSFKKGELPASYMGKHDTWPTRISYRLDNIPIKLRPCLQRNGVHGEDHILLGATIASLPNAVDSIYDHFIVEDYKHGTKTFKQVTFFLGNEPVLYAFSSDHSTLAAMYVDTSHICFKIGENYYRAGSYLSYDDSKFCTKQGDHQLVFKDMIIVTQDDPKKYDDVITAVYIGKLPE